MVLRGGRCRTIFLRRLRFTSNLGAGGSRKFGPAYAARLRRKSAKPEDIWHLDEVHLRIQGQVYWLWRAVDQEGYILDEILQTRRHAKAAQHLLRILLHKQGAKPARIVTDKLSSYAIAKRHVIPSIRRLPYKRLNDRAENSHLPLRKRERDMQTFRSPDGCQLFLSVFSAVRNLFVPPAKISSVLSKHIHRLQAFAQWNSVTTLSA